MNEELPIPQHYGCGGDDYPNDGTKRFLRRLNGPIDNSVSSCLSCHSLAESPRDLNILQVPYGEMECSNGTLQRWFRNINPRSATEPTFTNGYLSLDYSLQMREGLRRYCVNSYNHGRNLCGLPALSGKMTTVVTKEGVMSYPAKEN